MNLRLRLCFEQGVEEIAGRLIRIRKRQVRLDHD